MNKIIASFLIVCCIMLTMNVHSQSVSPSVLPGAGGYFAAANGSLSWTLGETVTPTLTSANLMLTQGFQQPFKATLHLKMYLEGYYSGGGQMKNVLYNQGITSVAGVECDTIEIQLRQSTVPYNMVSTSKSILKTNGTVTFGGNANLGSSYFIVIKHRNTIESWSANPVTLYENTLYDFTVGASKVYGDNQSEVESGVWALYSGDVVTDENIDLLDLGMLENDISDFAFGYFATDINGDGNVDLLDSPVVEGNVNAFIFSAYP